MDKKIDNPKVFISYAWGNKDYESKVLSFVSNLIKDGIDVIFDKFDLKEGNDTYAFMEQCATDSTVTNVLMLLDPNYAKKADDHTGGVGTETQIISAKVYQKVTQDKFIPIIMERDTNNNVCKPTYLQGRLHFDLSIPEEYDATYQRLVKTLYGVEIYEKPALGKKPEWVDTPIRVNTKTLVTYDSIKSLQSEKVKRTRFIQYLDEIKNSLVEFSNDDSKRSLKHEEYLSFYDETRTIRDDFLQLINNAIYVEDSQKEIAFFFEEIFNTINQNTCLSGEVVKIRIHELFIYSVANYLKNKDYSAIGYILGKTYFNKMSYGNDNMADSYKIFYSGASHQNLDNAVRVKDNKNYYTGTGEYWIQTIYSRLYSKEQFVLADLICYNYSIYGKNYISGSFWFPLTYVYDDDFNGELSLFAKKMVSKEYIQEVLPIFGYSTIDEFAQKIKEIEESSDKNYQNYRFSACFNSAPVLCYFIKAKDLATFN